LEIMFCSVHLKSQSWEDDFQVVHRGKYSTW
jgi:hypothetical protein